MGNDETMRHGSLTARLRSMRKRSGPGLKLAMRLRYQRKGQAARYQGTLGGDGVFGVRWLCLCVTVSVECELWRDERRETRRDSEHRTHISTEGKQMSVCHATPRRRHQPR